MGKLFYCLALVTMLAFASASAQWTQTSGPDGGEVLCLTSLNGNLFAGTRNGVFLSTDGSALWKPSGLKNYIVNSLAIRRMGPSSTYLFAATWLAGVFRSSDNGVTWTQLTFGLKNRNINAFAVVDTVLVAGTDTSGIFLSPANGSYWIPSNTGLTNTRINVLTASGTNVYAGTKGGLFLSVDRGASWTPVGFAGVEVTAVAVLDTVLVAGTTTNGVMRSTDNGASWTKISENEMGTNVNDLAVLNGTLYVAMSQGIYSSPNFGGYWIPSTTGLPSSAPLALYADGTTVYAGTYSGVYHSTDGGATWAAGNAGLRTTVVYSIASNGGDLVSGSRSGLFRSYNNGGLWQSPGINAWICSIAISGTKIAAGTWSQVISSLDNGTTWDYFSVPGYSGRVFALAFVGDQVLVGTEVSGVLLFKQTAPGSGSFTNTALTLTNLKVTSFAIKGMDIFTGTSAGIFHSTDGGQNWTAVDVGLTNLNISALAVNNFGIFAGTADGTAFRSTNNGASWQGANTGLAGYSVLCFAVADNAIFMGTWEGGVYVSTNNGGRWTAVNTGLMTSAVEPASVVQSLAVVGLDLFAGTQGAGVWRRPLSEMTTLDVPSANELPHEYALLQNYPNPFNPTTTIDYALPRRSHVTLTVFNTLGQAVAELANGEFEAGYHSVLFHANDLASGVYMYRLAAEGFTVTKKLMLLK